MVEFLAPSGVQKNIAAAGKFTAHLTWVTSNMGGDLQFNVFPETRQTVQNVGYAYIKEESYKK